MTKPGIDAVVTLVSLDTPDRERIDAVRQVSVDHVVDLAIQHGVASIVAKRLASLGVDLPPRSTRNLERLSCTRVALRLHVEHTLATLVDLLDVPFLVVKGPVIAERWFADPADREYGDLDVLVGRDDFRTVVDTLEAGGFTTPLANWHGWLEMGIAEMPLQLACTTVDLHWHLIAVAADRSGLRLPMDDMFERRVATTVGAASVPIETLDPEDTFLHVCTGIAVGGARRLRNLVDVDRALRDPDLDTGVFVERARAAGVGRLVAPVFDRCDRLLHTPGATALGDQFSDHRLWRAANGWIDRSRTTDGALRGFALSAGRSSVPATAAALVRSVGRSTVTRLGAVSPTAVEGRLHWQRRPEDGDVEGARRLYLDWVDGNLSGDAG